MLKYSPAIACAVVFLALSYAAVAQQALAVTVQVDAPQKKPGDSVTISGMVSSGGVGVAGALVGVTVTGPDGNPIVARSVSTSQSGSYAIDPFLLSTSAAGGTYAVTASASFQGQTMTGSTSFTVTSPVTRRCLVATAAFGSPVSPEVNLLREFRDSDLMYSRTGAAFMTTFNNWYYSFSPSLSEIIQSDDLLRVSVRIFLYPLVGILALSKTWFEAVRAVLGSDVAALFGGVLAGSLIGFTYLSFPAALLRAWKKEFCIARGFRYFGMVVAISALFLFLPFDPLSGLSSSTLVLAVAISSAALASTIVARLLVGPGRSILLSRD